MGFDSKTPYQGVGIPGRTILFEKFSNDGQNLARLLDEKIFPEADNDRALQDITNALEVRSYEEFKEKFSPTLYLCMQGKDNQPVITYLQEYNSCDEEEKQRIEVKIENQQFFRMVDMLCDKRKSDGSSNLDFDYEELKKLMMPAEKAKRFKNIRKNLTEKQKELAKAEEKGLPMSKIKALKQERNNYRIKMINECSGDPLLTFLPIAIADKEIKVKALTVGNNTLPGKTADTTPLIPMKFEFDPEGNLKPVPFEKTAPALTTGDNVSTEEEKSDFDGENSQLATSDSGKALPAVAEKYSNSALIDMISNDFQKNLPQVFNNEYLMGLVMNSLDDDPYRGKIIDREEERKNREAQLADLKKVYNIAQQNFIDAAERLVEKVVGVKMFFEHACQGTQKALENGKGLLVANCNVSDLLDSDIKSKLEQFLVKANGTPERRFWFAMIPGIDTDGVDILDDDGTRIELDDEDDDDSYNTGSINVVRTTKAEAKQLLDILAKNKIVTFFNMKADTSTGFSSMSKEKLDEYKEYTDRFKPEIAEYAVICYPNFTVLPAAAGDFSDGFQSNGIFIDACYIACGMVCGMQSVSYLQSKGLNVNPNLINVRIDLEEHNRLLTTCMSRELNYNWTQDIYKFIGSYGFCFCADAVFGVSNVYVHVARTLARSSSDPSKYKQLFSILTRVFIEQYLKGYGLSGTGVKKTNVDKFHELIKEWKKTYPDCDNAIFRQDEDIEIVGNSIRVVFGHQDESEISLDIVD